MPKHEPETMELKPNYPQVMRFMAHALADDTVVPEGRRNFVGSFVELVRYVAHTDPDAVKALVTELQTTPPPHNNPYLCQVNS
jgi:hypothetical protein